MKKVLITGGFGFLGGRIGQYLSSLGYKIFLGSRSQQGVPSWLKDADPVRLDWDNKSQLVEVCKGMNIIIHAAGMNAEDSSKDPISSFEFNTLGTMKLIEASRLAKIDQFVYLSTAHVYNSPLVGIIDEEICPKNLHPYATSHLSAEFAVSYAHNKDYFKAYSLRLSNGFGSPTFPDVTCWKLFVNDLCRQVVMIGKLVLNSDGKQQRDFIPITNISKMIGNLLRQENRLPFNTFNIGSGYSMTLEGMAKRIQSRAEVLFNFIPQIEIREQNGNTSELNLEYKVERLKSLNLFEESEIDNEIDDLLLFCNRNFHPNV